MYLLGIISSVGDRNYQYSNKTVLFSLILQSLNIHSLLILGQLVKKKKSQKNSLFHYFQSTTFGFGILMLVASWSQNGYYNPRRHVCLQGRKTGKKAVPMIFLLLLFLLYRNKICPRRPPVYSHLCLIGRNWVMWPALAAMASGRANIWLSRNFGHRQQGSR